MHALTSTTWWPGVALPTLLLLACLLGFLLNRLSRSLLHRLAARTAVTWDDALVARIGVPLTLAFTLVITRVTLPWLELSDRIVVAVGRGLHVVLLLIVFWTFWRVVDVVAKVIADHRWSAEHQASRALVPLGRRLTKVAVILAAIVVSLSELGYSVASLVAGLGIGGLAVALAARSTLENLFGAFSIGADQPFREGDVIKIDDVLGTVEAVGLRSTRIRTLDRTLVSLPNGKLADMRIESYSARDRIRLNCTLGLVYGTTAAQVREVLAGLERVLREHPKIWPETVVVRFAALGASSLDIEVMAWFETPDFNEFGSIRGELLLRFMEVVERAGSSFAFPTRTIHVSPGIPSGFRGPGGADSAS
jgi:MscS family membrane protein